MWLPFKANSAKDYFSLLIYRHSLIHINVKKSLPHTSQRADLPSTSLVATVSQGSLSVREARWRRKWGSCGALSPRRRGSSRWATPSTSTRRAWRALWTTRWRSASPRRSWPRGTSWPEPIRTSATSASASPFSGAWACSCATVCSSPSGQCEAETSLSEVFLQGSVRLFELIGLIRE